MKLTSMTTWSGTVALAAMMAISSRAEAQTASNADAVYAGYLKAYLVQSGSSAHFTSSISSRSVAYMWNQAEDITGFEDHWYRTYSPATATLVGDLLNTFESNNSGTDWTWDDYNDDLGWATIAFVRGYAITGNAAFLDVAAKNFTTVWTRGWDSAGGGGIWEQVGNGNEKQKSVLATGTFIITGAALYQATGKATYLSEAEMAYAWVRANVFNATSATNSVGAPGHVDEGLTNTNALQNTSNIYNEGLMLESAAALYTLTNSAEYLNDAKLIIAYVETQWPIVNHQSDMLFRGVANFAWQNDLWSTYYPYLSANAKAAWNVRRTDYNISNDTFTTATSSTADLQSMQAMSSLTIQEATANSFMPPATVNLSGTYEVQNVASGLALTVSGGATTDGAAVVQVSFASGAGESLWTFVPASNPGYYRIQSVESGLDVDVSNASSVIGALMVQRPAVLASPWTDQWLPVPNSDGTFSFYNLATTLAIEDPAASAAENTQLDQSYPNGSDAEKFKLVLVSNARTDAGAGAGGDASGDGASEAPMGSGGDAGGTSTTPSDAGSGGPNGSVGEPPASGSNGSGCGCVTAGPSSQGTSGGTALLALLGALAVARRPRANTARRTVRTGKATMSP
jgi:MYXO-CTERM domain-containing protein